MPHRAVAIANEFLKLPGAGERLTQMQLQKLVYFAHGWNWAINGEALVADDAEAWSFGPVYRDLYEHTRYFGRDPIGRQISPDDSQIAHVFGDQILGASRPRRSPYVAPTTDRERQVISHVAKRYAGLSGSRLSELTHRPGTPWFEAYRRGKNTPLDQSLIRQHYANIAARVAHPAA